MDWKIYVRLFFIILLLFSLYLVGAPFSAIILMGAVFLVVLFLRGPVYKKIDDYLINKFPSFGKLHPWVQKIIIFLIFIVFYYLLKQILFFGLKLAGFDIQQMILDSIEIPK